MSNPASMFEGGKGESRAAGDILVTDLGEQRRRLQPCGPFHSSAAAKKTSTTATRPLFEMSLSY
jgi:hypothetical protein